MEIKESIKRLEASEEFADWRKDHEDSFLAHVFVMMDAANKDTLQVGYYSESKQGMSTFFLTENTISVSQDAEVLRSEGELLPLNLDDVNITSAQALISANKLKDEEYKNEQVIKHFFILQTIDEKATFNITFITQALKTLNVKINASDGTTIKHSLESLIHMPPEGDN